MRAAYHAILGIEQIQVADCSCGGKPGRGHPVGNVQLRRPCLPVTIYPRARIGRIAQLGPGDRLPALKVGSEESAFKSAPGDFSERAAAPKEGLGQSVDLWRVFTRSAMSMFHAHPQRQGPWAFGQALGFLPGIHRKGEVIGSIDPEHGALHLRQVN